MAAIVSDVTVTLLTKECNGLIKLALGLLADTTGVT